MSTIVGNEAAAPQTTGADRGPRERWIRILAAVVVGVSTLLVAWTAFQNSEWTRERFARSDDAADLSDTADDLLREAAGEENRDRQLFVAWIEATSEGRTVSARAIRSILRPEFATAFDAWLDQEPLRGDGTFASSPFQMPGYDAAEDAARANELTANARNEERRAEDAARVASDYAFLTFLFVTCLVLDAVSSRMRRRPLRLATLGAATALLVVGIALLALLPVSFDL